MFERFAAAYRVTDGSPVGSGDDLTARFGGCTFEDGLYRVHTAESSPAASRLVVGAFPDFRGRAACFGFDWLGRQFARDSQRDQVLMFEPGTGQVLEIPVPFSAFHDQELVEYGEAALARSFFDEWRATGQEPLAFDQCVGYRVPLFLGGKDTVDNLEVIDMEVYWALLGQLRLGTLRMPAGTTVSQLTIDD